MAPIGYQPHYGPMYGHSRRPGGHLALALNTLANAIEPKDDQITGITRSQDLPAYPNDRHVAFKSEKEVEAKAMRVEDPPAYTPRAAPPNNGNNTTYDSPLPPQAQAQHLAQHPTFTTLPILQTPALQLSPNISADITHLSSALKSLQLGERGARCAAKRAGKQLARDLWEVEMMKRGGQRHMSCAEKKMVRAQIREVKGAVRGEIREMRCR